MSSDPMTPESFNTELRSWVKHCTNRAFHLVMENQSKSSAYNKTSKSNLISLDEVLEIVARCRPANLSPDDAEEWVRLFSREWREKWEAAERHIRTQRPAAAVPAVKKLDANTVRRDPAPAPALSGSTHAANIEAFDRIGLIHAFVPLASESGVAPTSTNARRNARKLEILQAATAAGSTVRLLAETGNSYLHLRGPFNAALSQLLDKGGRVQVVLMDPADHLRGDQDELRMKFKQSIRGFKELERSYPARIDLRVLRSRLTATILMTEDSAFFEPYLHVEDDERERLLLTTFELEFDSRSRVYKTLSGTLDLHYNQAESPARWLGAP